MVNQTIEHQLNHRSIRKFKAENLSDEQIKTLLEVARQTSTSNFFQQFSVLHITDETKREQIRHISKQPYVGLNGELFIFIADSIIKHSQDLEDVEERSHYQPPQLSILRR